MTPLELQVLDLFRDRLEHTGFAPTVREAAAETKHSLQTVHTALSRLVERGLLKRIPYRRRGIVLADRPDMRSVPTDALRAELARRGVTFDALDDRPRGQFRRGVASCAADCCQEQVERGKLFCRRHWFLLPFSLRQDILNAFGAGDEEKYLLFVSEARDRIGRGAGVADPRRQS